MLFRRLFGRRKGPKQFLPEVLSALIVVCAFFAAGCRPNENTVADPEEIRFVVTIPPFAAILEGVGGDRAKIHTLIVQGASPHTYAPRPSDVRISATARAIFYGSPDLDGWASSLTEKESVSLISLLPESERGWILSEDGSRVTDPHFWTDPLAVASMLPSLVQILCDLDSVGCDLYAKQSEVYQKELQDLHQTLNGEISPLKGTAYVLSEPFFNYFLRRYDLIPLTSLEQTPGVEPTPKDLQNIIRAVNDGNVRAILAIESVPSEAATTLAAETGIPIIRLNPFGGTTETKSLSRMLEYNVNLLLGERL